LLVIVVDLGEGTTVVGLYKQLLKRAFCIQSVMTIKITTFYFTNGSYSKSDHLVFILFSSLRKIKTVFPEHHHSNPAL